METREDCSYVFRLYAENSPVRIRAKWIQVSNKTSVCPEKFSHFDIMVQAILYHILQLILCYITQISTSHHVDIDRGKTRKSIILLRPSFARQIQFPGTLNAQMQLTRRNLFKGKMGTGRRIHIILHGPCVMLAMIGTPGQFRDGG